MPNNNNRSVFQRQDGQWANKRNSAEKAASLHRTQSAADAAARKMLHKSGGGELTKMGRSGRIVSKDTIEPGHESKVRDKEH